MSESSVLSKTVIRLRRAIKVLEMQFGEPSWETREPLEELIVTILSQNTNDNNRDVAFARLKTVFPRAEDLLNADVKEIEEAIRPAGLAGQKSTRIKTILKWIDQTFDCLTLEPLREMTNDEAIELLTSQKGIGVKTAAVLLAFSFNRDLCPVDTHVHRISKRLGWIDDEIPADRAFYILKQHIPEGRAISFHLNLLKFGRSICTARNPKCDECPLWNNCVWEGRKPKINL